MKKFSKEFLLGAATAAHQVEGNNIHSDFWAMEQMKNSSFIEPSLDAVDHYNRFKEDIDLIEKAGLNAYRFSIEWARIEPQKGEFDENEISHYRDMIEYCIKKGIEPIVTLHHFSSPKWLIEEGGWENEDTIQYFKRYSCYVIKNLGELLTYICTINEANMGLQITAIAKSYRKNMNIQVGINEAALQKREEADKELSKVFGGIPSNQIHHYHSPRTEKGDILIIRAHVEVRDAIKDIYPHLKVGVTLSLHDFQTKPGGEQEAAEEWNEEFTHYLPYIKNDDFFGIQNYTRKLIGPDGVMAVPDGAERTQMNYEFYPQALEHVIRKVAAELNIPIMITENGVATADDGRRVAFISEALDGIHACLEDGISVIGYMYWSLLDNFEWQVGYSRTFGLIEVDRDTQKRNPKKSLNYLGSNRV